jgi:signal transduction histidine kinase
MSQNKQGDLNTVFLNSKLHDLTISIIFGVLSSFFGHIFFEVLGYKYAYTDLREVPILIGIFYLRNPLYLLIIILLGSYRFLNHYPYWVTVIMHIPAGFFAYYAYHKLIKSISNVWKLGVLWGLVILIYYYIVIMPSFVISYEIFGLNINPDLIENYLNLSNAARYEIITTLLVTTLYAIQLFYSNHLRKMNVELEQTVDKRTLEIAQVNEQLLQLNANLEHLVEERTQRINEQLEKFQRYAHLNSHDLRAPLARVMGLVLLLQDEKDPAQREDILKKLMHSSKELDGIIHQMNRLLNMDEDIQ